MASSAASILVGAIVEVSRDAANFFPSELIPVGRFQSTRGATPRTKALAAVVAGALPLMET
eukprot:1373904-Prymnesium_polylepis.1